MNRDSHSRLPSSGVSGLLGGWGEGCGVADALRSEEDVEQDVEPRRSRASGGDSRLSGISMAGDGATSTPTTTTTSEPSSAACVCVSGARTGPPTSPRPHTAVRREDLEEKHRAPPREPVAKRQRPFPGDRRASDTRFETVMVSVSGPNPSPFFFLRFDDSRSNPRAYLPSRNSAPCAPVLLVRIGVTQIRTLSILRSVFISFLTPTLSLLSTPHFHGGVR